MDMTEFQIGDHICIWADAPLYPEGWKRGEMPPSTRPGETGVVLDVRPEADVQPRTFYRIMCATGIGWINGAFLEKPL